eukprot:355657-Chlamydomonas_euryale.AAC.2
MSTPCAARMSTSAGSLGRTTKPRRESTASADSDAPLLVNDTRSILPSSTACTRSKGRNWEGRLARGAAGRAATQRCEWMTRAQPCTAPRPACAQQGGGAEWGEQAASRVWGEGQWRSGHP